MEVKIHEAGQMSATADLLLSLLVQAVIPKMIPGESKDGREEA